MPAEASPQVRSQQLSTVWHHDFSWNTFLTKISSDFGHHYFGQPSDSKITILCFTPQVKELNDETSCLNTTTNFCLMLCIYKGAGQPHYHSYKTSHRGQSRCKFHPHGLKNDPTLRNEAGSPKSNILTWKNWYQNFSFLKSVPLPIK